MLDKVKNDSYGYALPEYESNSTSQHKLMDTHDSTVNFMFDGSLEPTKR